MAQQIINIGDPDKGNGDPLRTAFSKIKQNFAELYNHVSAGVSASSTAPTDPGAGDLWWDTVSGRLYVYFGSSWVDASPVDGAGISSTNQLVNGNKTVSLATTGILTLPYSNYLETTDVNLKVGSQGSVTIRSNAASNLTDHEWIFDASGNLTVPDRITFSDDTWQSTAFIGHAYSLRNSPTGNLYVTLDDSGTINTPLLLPKTFTAVLNPAHYVGEGTLVLEGNAWEYTVQFQVGQDGIVQTMIDNQPWPSNPGYINGVVFEFVEADHGIPGYTFTFTLNSIQNPGPGVYTANPAVSEPPNYPATIQSLGAIKLAANSASWTFGTDGNLSIDGKITHRANSAELDLNNGSTNNVLLTTTDGFGDTSLLLDTTGGALLFSNRNVMISAATGGSEAYDAYTQAEANWVEARNQDAILSAPETRPWAGMSSGDAYPELMGYSGPNPPSPTLPQLASTAIYALSQWQAQQDISTVSVAAADKVWLFKGDGELTVPGAIFRDGALYMNSQGSTTTASVIALGNAGSVILRTSNQSTNHDLTFDVNGKLTVPGELSIGGQAYTSSGIIWLEESTERVVMNYVTADDRFVISTNRAGSAKYWYFGDNGNLQLPAGGDIVDSNGTSVLGGSNLKTIQTVSTTGSEVLITGDVVLADPNAAGGAVQVRLPNAPPAGTEVTVKNINTGAYAVYVGASIDASVPIETEFGLVSASAYGSLAATGNSITWIFDGTAWRIIHKNMT